MNTGIHIGADVASLKAALPEVAKALLAIIATPAGDDVKKAAIAALTDTFAVDNVSLNNCTVSGS